MWNLTRHTVSEKSLRKQRFKAICLLMQKTLSIAWTRISSCKTFRHSVPRLSRRRELQNHPICLLPEKTLSPKRVPTKEIPLPWWCTELPSYRWLKLAMIRRSHIRGTLLMLTLHVASNNWKPFMTGRRNTAQPSARLTKCNITAKIAMKWSMKWSSPLTKTRLKKRWTSRPRFLSRLEISVWTMKKQEEYKGMVEKLPKHTRISAKNVYHYSTKKLQNKLTFLIGKTPDLIENQPETSQDKQPPAIASESKVTTMTKSFSY